MSSRPEASWRLVGLALALALGPSLAAQAGAESPSDSGATELEPIVVYGSRLTVLQRANRALDAARDQELLPSLGASAFEMNESALEALPLGADTPLDKVLLRAPGVSSDSAISNPDFHVRNEYSNVQYRINGIQLPDGVSALGSVLETAFIANLTLLDGVLPAQYGLRTAGVVDIRTKSAFAPGGNFNGYGGSLGTVSPSIDYGGNFGSTEYFVVGRYLSSDEGLENAAATANPLHDHTRQEKVFTYSSTVFGEASRVTSIAGAWIGHFQIPDMAGIAPLGDFGPSDASSARLDERETDRFYFGVLALQTQRAAFDAQLSIFTRYAAVHFLPDVRGDLEFNDVASDVRRASELTGMQFDAADRLGSAHTLRAGATFSIERTHVDNTSTVLPLGPSGTPLPTPVTLTDARSRLGWTAGAYLQDEWRLDTDLTVNTGLRFDRMQQFVSAGQVSPRVVLLYQPGSDTHVHAGVSRYFTPPQQAQATPVNLQLFRNTTQQQATPLEAPVRPERSTYIDVGIEQQWNQTLTVGIDVYAKHATDAVDDGQFGQAVVLEQYNYARGFSRGVELKADYRQDGLNVYANLAVGVSKVRTVTSNQYLIGDPAELAYIADHYVYSSDSQTVTASTGLSYRWGKLLASLDGLYGSGLRTGFANAEHTAGYTQWNAALARDFEPWGTDKPLAVRLSVMNLFDRSYLLRSGDGIGEFAPQYGPRRQLYLGLSQHF